MYCWTPTLHKPGEDATLMPVQSMQVVKARCGILLRISWTCRSLDLFREKENSGDRLVCHGLFFMLEKVASEQSGQEAVGGDR